MFTSSLKNDTLVLNSKKKNCQVLIVAEGFIQVIHILFNFISYQSYFVDSFFVLVKSNAVKSDWSLRDWDKVITITEWQQYVNEPDTYISFK